MDPSWRKHPHPSIDPWLRRHMPVSWPGSRPWLAPSGPSGISQGRPRNLKQPRTSSSSQHFLPMKCQVLLNAHSRSQSTGIALYRPRRGLQLPVVEPRRDRLAQVPAAELGHLDNLDNPPRSRPFYVFAFLDFAGHYVKPVRSFSP